MKTSEPSQDQNPTDTGNNFLSDDEVMVPTTKQQNVKLSKKAREVENQKKKAQKKEKQYGMYLKKSPKSGK